MDSSTPSTATRCLSVRFEDTCVLIPPACLPSKPSLIRPRLITKSYSLPFWKTTPSKKSPSAPQSPIIAPDRDPAADAEADKVEKRAFSLTVSVPSLTTKTKPRRPAQTTASPCLSRRHFSPSRSSDTGSSSTSPTSSPLSDYPPITAPIFAAPPLQRTPTVPQIQPANLKEADTIPLRPCCEDCHACVDAALAEGERWSERWSRGAVRRYSEGEHVHLDGRPHPAVFGVTRVWTPHHGCEDTSLSKALQVDEVEVKRRSGEFAHASLNNRPVPPSLDEEALADSDEEELCQTLAPPLPCQEEDEDMLFPLPSPRRSPNNTPSPTPRTGSLVNLIANQSQTDLPSTACEDDKAQAADPTSTPIAQPVPHSYACSLPVLAAQPAPASITQPILPTIQPTASPPPLTDTIPAGSAPASPAHTSQRSTSPSATRQPQPRRPSFSAASGSLLKGSASMLRGVAAGMAGAGVGVR